MFVWARLPEAYQEMGSLEFSRMLIDEAQVAVSPGMGFGPGGEGYVRFALIENEQRIAQACRSLRRGLPAAGAQRSRRHDRDGRHGDRSRWSSRESLS